jgi:hypothetical protein
MKQSVGEKRPINMVQMATLFMPVVRKANTPSKGTVTALMTTLNTSANTGLGWKRINRSAKGRIAPGDR